MSLPHARLPFRLDRRFTIVSARPLSELVHPSWVPALDPVADQITALGAMLRAGLAEGVSYLPAGDRVLRAFADPFDAVRVLVVGQDPYPTPGHPIGLSFAVDRSVRPLPRSLQNIYRELAADTGIQPPSHGDLSAWTGQGVLLLNRVLTVIPRKPGSHRRRGWEQVTAAAVQALAARGRPLVAILWGRDAQGLGALLGEVPRIESAHPSPMSADRGFFGSRPFTRANDLLVRQGGTAVDWSLPD